MPIPVVNIEVPVRTYSLNKLLRMHWRARQHHNKTIATAFGWVFRADAPKYPPALPVTVLLARIAPRKLDGDNLQGSLKTVRDLVAEYLGVDDADERVAWIYDQYAGDTPRYYAVRISIERKS